jgi:hypothetical protein
MTLEKWIERFHAYNKGGVVFDYDKRMELLFFLEELKEKKRNRKGGMTRTEDNAWYLLCGVLMGMVLAFWSTPDIDFFRCEWPVIMGALIVWAFVRRGKDGEEG